MIDISNFNSFQKDFLLEVNQIKFIITLQNELKINFQSLKNLIEAESKTIDTFSKSLTCQVYSFLNDSSTVNDDPTNCLKFSNVFISVFNNYATLLGDEIANFNNTIYKMNKEISDDYANSTNNLLETSIALFKELTASKNKFRNQSTKGEKILKELENFFQNRRKLEIDRNFQSAKTKLDEKIVSLFNELDENKGQLLLTFDVIKRDEIDLNELIKNYFLNSVKYTFDNYNRLKSYSNLILTNKININNRIKNSLLEGLNTLNMIEIDFSENYERKFSDLKNIKYDDIECIVVDDINKINFTTLLEGVSNYMNCLSQCISIRKKILNFLYKFFNEIIKHSENFISNYQKLIKNIYISPKITLCNSQSVIGLFDFLRSFFELNVKKTDEWNKSISNNSLILIDVVSKELITEESNLINFWTKFSKDIISFKEKNIKFNFQKEKILTNILQVKGEILKTSDDPNNFSKYESRLHNLRIDESIINDSINDNVKKYKKYLDENFELLKSNVRLFKMKEAQKFQEIKESLNFVIKSIEKVVTHINDFLQLGNQIFESKEKEDVKNTYIKYVKDFHIEESILNDYFENLEQFTYKSYSVKKTFLISDLCYKEKILFLNKENNFTFKDLNPDFIKDEEINEFSTKLSLNKTNVRPIELEASLLSGNLSNDIIESFHCAYLDKNLCYGRLTITSKIIYIYYFISSANLNKTLIQIPIIDITSIEKKQNIVFHNSILIKSKTQDYYLTSFILRDKCYRTIYKLLLENGIIDENHKPLSNINSGSNSVHENNVLFLNIQSDIEEINSCSPSQEKNLNNQINSNKLNPICTLTHSIIESDDIERVLNEINFFEKLKEMHIQRLETIKVRTNYQNFIVKEENLGDIPLHLIFRHLYDYRQTCVELEKGKNFLSSLADLKNDTNLKFINDEVNKDNIPHFFNSTDYINEIFYSKMKADILIKFLEDINNWINISYDFHYKYTHPCKKVFMGPDKLELDDHYKVFFISPLCLIIEINTYCSGFMLVDTFITIGQYKFESEIFYDEKQRRIAYKTKVSINHAIDFIKPNIFKSRVESEGTKEYSASILEILMPLFKKVLSNQSKSFYDSFMNNSKKNLESSQLKIHDNCSLVIYQNNDKNLYSLMNLILSKLEKLENKIIQLDS